MKTILSKFVQGRANLKVAIYVGATWIGSVYGWTLEELLKELDEYTENEKICFDHSSVGINGRLFVRPSSISALIESE